MLNGWVQENTVFGEDVSVSIGCIVGAEPRGTKANRRPIDRNWSCVRIGDRVVIRPFTCIHIDVHIGEDTLVGNHVTMREGVRVGQRCVVGAYADLQYNVKLGNDVRVMNQAHITGGTVIGDGSFVGPGVLMANDPYLFHEDLADYKDRGQVPPVIGERVFIGVGAIILPGVRIGDGAKIAAKALVTRDVPAGAVMVGAPAKQRVANPASPPNGDTGGISNKDGVRSFM